MSPKPVEDNTVDSNSLHSVSQHNKDSMVPIELVVNRRELFSVVLSIWKIESSATSLSTNQLHNSALTELPPLHTSEKTNYYLYILIHFI